MDEKPYTGIESKEGITEKKIVEEFKNIISKMHDGLPQYYFFGYLERLIPNKEIRDYFFKNNVFVKSKTKTNIFDQDRYFLGINGITLANNYQMEKLTQSIKNLTKWIVGISLVTLVVSLLA